MRKLKHKLSAFSFQLSAIIFLLMADSCPLTASTVDAQYSFTDYSTHPLNVKRITVTPLGPSADYAGAILTTKPIIYTANVFYTMTNGTVTVTNLVAGYAYRLAFSDGFSEPTITNYFGTNLSGTVGGVTNRTTFINWQNGVAVGIWYQWSTTASGTVQTNISYLAVTNSPWVSNYQSGVRLTNFTASAYGAAGTKAWRAIDNDGVEQAYINDEGLHLPGTPLSSMDADGRLLFIGDSGYVNRATSIPYASLSGIETMATTNGATYTSFIESKLIYDPDALSYLRITGKTNSLYRDRAINGFVALKESGLWTSLIDGAVLGTNLNLSGSYWATLKLNYGTNVNNPTVTADGLLLTGGTNRAYVRNLADMRTNTIIVCVDMMGFSSNAIIVAQRSTTSDGSVGIIAQPYVDSPTYAAAPIKAYLANTVASAYAMSNSFPYWTQYGISGRNWDEHYLAYGVDGLRRTILTDGFADSAPANSTFMISNAVTSLNLGAFLNGDDDSTTTGFFCGRIKSFLVFNRMLNTNEIHTAQTCLRWFDVREGNDIFIGDSISAAYEDAYDYNGYPSTGHTNNWPHLYENSPATTNRNFYRNFSRGGFSIIDFTSAQYSNSFWSFRPGGPVKWARAWYALGANDLLQFRNMTNAFVDAKASFALMNRDGFKIQAMTVRPMTNSTFSPVGMLTNDSYRVGYNMMLVTNQELFDRVWKVDEIVPIRTNGGWYADGVHPTYVNNLRVAQWLINDGKSIPDGSVVVCNYTLVVTQLVADVVSLGKRMVYYRDDFIAGWSDTAIGSLGWVTIGATAVRNSLYDAWSPRWGTSSLESGSTSGTGATLLIGGSGGSYSGTLPISTLYPWRATFVFRMMSTNVVGHALGFYNHGASAWGTTAQGAYIRYDTSLADTNFVFITRNGSTVTTNHTLIGPDTNWHTATIYCNVQSNIVCTVDASTPVTNSASLPGNCSPFIAVIPRENAAKTNVIDFFEFVAWPNR